ncbi:MAG: DUF6044 family protein, partial [Bacteroidia bacterium]
MISLAFVELNEGKITSRAVLSIVVFAAYSFLYHTGIFIILLLGIYVVVYFFRHKKIHWQLIFGASLLVGVYAVVEYLTIWNLLTGAFPSHRVSFSNIAAKLSAGEVLTQSANRFFKGNYHAGSYPGKLLWLLVAATFVITYIKTRKINKEIILLAMCAAMIAIGTSVLEYKGLAGLYSRFHILEQINFRRIDFFLSFLLFLAFALSWKQIAEQFSAAYSGVLCLIMFAGIGYSLYNLDKQNRSDALVKNITFEKYVAAETMQSVKQHLLADTAHPKVLHCMISPDISQYAGIATLDGYFNNYPLEYKKKFRKLIAPYLEQNKTEQAYFDNWGNRCYLNYARQMKELAKKDSVKLEIDPEMLRTLGGTHILSAKPLTNAEQLGLVYRLTVVSNNPHLSKISIYQFQR